jgi:hypothetical protein
VLIQPLAVRYRLYLTGTHETRTCATAELDEHVDSEAERGVIDDLAVPFLLNLGEELSDELCADLLVEDDVVFELTGLQLVHVEELLLGHVVAVHVHEYVLDHNEAQLHLLPHLVHPLEQVLVTAAEELLDHRL